MKYNELFIYGNVSKSIKRKAEKNMNVYNMSLFDAFKAALYDTTLKKDSELFKAWYYEDFRRFIPFAYDPMYLDFNKFPLKYTTLIFSDLLRKCSGAFQRVSGVPLVGACFCSIQKSAILAL